MKKKNILFILTDDQRFNTIHALGNEQIKTPNLDILAAHSTVFTQAHIPCGTSGAVCMPSRAMIHTGRTLFHLEGEGQSIPERFTTMGECFTRAGYETFGTGKWHNGPAAFTRSFSKGDNIFFGGMWDHWNVPLCNYDKTGEYDNVVDFVANFWDSNNVMKIHCDKFIPGKHSTELLTDTALEFLKSRDETRPFFLYLAYLAPHDPRTMPQRFKEMYKPEDIELPASFAERHPFDFGVQDIRDEVLAAYPRTEKEIKRHIAEYYGMISHLDYEIGKLFTLLKEKNLLEDTIIVFTGDNGLAVGCHGLMGKQNHYEHSVRVPLMVYDGEHSGQQCDSYVYLLDIYPTLCELSGLDIPDSVEGRSFAGLLEDTSLRTRDDLYFAYNELIRSVKKDGFKLIEYRNYAHTSQLFDVVNDPNELVNLFNKPEYAGKVHELQELMQRYRSEWEDTGHRYSDGFWNEHPVAD